MHNLKAVLAGVPMSVKPSDDYWEILGTLVERSPAFASITATDTLIAMIQKMQFQNWSDYRKDPCILLELVAAMLKDSGVEPDALSRIQTVVASTLEVAEQNNEKKLLGEYASDH